MDFNEIIKTNKQNVKNIIRLITKQENEDLEQEVYIKLWKSCGRYEERGTFKGWINAITKNASKDYLKSAAFKQSQSAVRDELAMNCIKDKKTTPEDRAAKSERQKRVIDAVESLKPKLKETILLCEIYGYTYEEAAKKLKCPIGTIKSRIYNAKKELAEVLDDLIRDEE